MEEDEMAAPKSIRSRVLLTAEHLVTVEREGVHGAPNDTLTRIAALWNAYLGLQGKTLTAADAAIMLALLKAARQRSNPGHEDNYVDGAAYFALAAELAISDEDPSDGLV